MLYKFAQFTLGRSFNFGYSCFVVVVVLSTVDENTASPLVIPMYQSVFFNSGMFVY